MRHEGNSHSFELLKIVEQFPSLKLFLKLFVVLKVSESKTPCFRGEKGKFLNSVIHFLPHVFTTHSELELSPILEPDEQFENALVGDVLLQFVDFGEGENHASRTGAFHPDLVVGDYHLGFLILISIGSF